jgi:hypothetical protein
MTNCVVDLAHGYLRESHDTALLVLADALEEAGDLRHLRLRYYLMLLEKCQAVPVELLEEARQNWLWSRSSYFRRSHLPQVRYFAHVPSYLKYAHGMGHLLSCAMLRNVLPHVPYLQEARARLGMACEARSYRQHLKQFIALRELMSLGILGCARLADWLRQPYQSLDQPLFASEPAQLLYDMAFRLRRSRAGGGGYTHLFDRLPSTLPKVMDLSDPRLSRLNVSGSVAQRLNTTPEQWQRAVLFSWLYRMYRVWVGLGISDFEYLYGQKPLDMWYRSHGAPLAVVTTKTQEVLQ